MKNTMKKIGFLFFMLIFGHIKALEPDIALASLEVNLNQLSILMSSSGDKKGGHQQQAQPRTFGAIKGDYYASLYDFKYGSKEKGAKVVRDLIQECKENIAIVPFAERQIFLNLINDMRDTLKKHGFLL